MTKEELKKEAEEKASIYFDSLEVDNGNVSDTPFSAYDVFVAYEKGALEFAEPREKRIAELEKEVKEWKDKADLWCKTANLKDHNIMINKELEKENAELKEKLKPENCLKLLAKEGYIKFTSDQLTKAKELLKKLLVHSKRYIWIADDNNKPIMQKEIAEAEQFISEVENDSRTVP